MSLLDDSIDRARAACPGYSLVDEAVWEWLGKRIRGCLSDDPYRAQEFYSANERTDPDTWGSVACQAIKALLQEPETRYNVIVSVVSFAVGTQEIAIKDDMPALFGAACVARHLGELTQPTLEAAFENHHLLGPHAFCHLSDISEHLPASTDEERSRRLLMLMAMPCPRDRSEWENKREKMRIAFLKELENGNVPDLTVGNAGKALTILHKNDPNLAAHVEKALLVEELPGANVKKTPQRRM